ncbi:MAG TPA: hypothetical protein VLA56_21350 [Pseudomonadales bacterium]|nr:hypothetical protein [Pseudomonadales bacterium]
MSTLIHERVAACRSGTNPTCICRVRSGWVVIGDVQFLPGYALLLPDPVVPDLNALPAAARTEFLADMTCLGDALLETTGAERINYEILGNGEAALHAHLFPRYGNEDQGLRRRPAWFYDWDRAPPFDRERDAPLMTSIAVALQRDGVSR